MAGETPLQHVHRGARVPVTVEDLRDRDEAGQRRAIDAWLGEEQAAGFAWDRPPLFRVGVHILADERFSVGVSFHHALLDGWSFATLASELMALYRAGIAGTAAALRPLPVEYRDFIRQETLDSADPAREAFWRARVGEIRSPLLPAQPTGLAAATRRTEIEVPDALAAAVTRLASQAGVPVKTVLLPPIC